MKLGQNELACFQKKIRITRGKEKVDVGDSEAGSDGARPLSALPAPCAAINLCLHWRFDAALSAPCPAKLLSLTPTSVGHRLSGRRPFHRRKDKQRHFDQSASPFSSRRDKSAFVPSSFTSS
ncbi:hypothetical protein T01_861 [Trichinella spiralis]|uniref:Uncharacterized protein n=1 Tax=Trichinella spiralis TaxID=6334 RepID=A0A0V1BMR7_TRISP|nr:hypothetical protein T01_861 [Trichinella spiralis]